MHWFWCRFLKVCNTKYAKEVIFGKRHCKNAVGSGLITVGHAWLLLFTSFCKSWDSFKQTDISKLISNDTDQEYKVSMYILCRACHNLFCLLHIFSVNKLLSYHSTLDIFEKIIKHIGNFIDWALKWPKYRILKNC